MCVCVCESVWRIREKGVKRLYLGSSVSVRHLTHVHLVVLSFFFHFSSTFSFIPFIQVLAVCFWNLLNCLSVFHSCVTLLFLFFLRWVCSVVTMISVFFLFLSCACCLMSEDDAYVDKLPNFEKRVDVLAGMVWSCPGWLPFFKISHYPLGLMMTGHFFYPQSTRLQRSFVIHDSFFPHNSHLRDKDGSHRIGSENSRPSSILCPD